MPQNEVEFVMAVLTTQQRQTTQEILAAIERLDPVELDQIARHVKRLRTAKPRTEQQQREVELLRLIRRYPSELGPRYRTLLRKLEAETLTQEERQELLPLTEIAEAFAVRRLEALVELAVLRRTTLPDIMRELDIRPRRV